MCNCLEFYSFNPLRWRWNHFCVSWGCGYFIITHWGCVLYTVPSTPTVTLKTLTFRFCLIRVRMADRPAATRLEDLKDTMVLTCCTAMQSSWDGLKPRCIKMSLVFFRPFLYLRKRNIKKNIIFLFGTLWVKRRTYSSIAATSAVVIFPLVLRASDTCPSNNFPSFAIFNTTNLTNSPRYIPLTIFSNLKKANMEQLIYAVTVMKTHLSFLTFVFQGWTTLRPLLCQTLL